jgi:uncharacterized protein
MTASRIRIFTCDLGDSLTRRRTDDHGGQKSERAISQKRLAYRLNVIYFTIVRLDRHVRKVPYVAWMQDMTALNQIFLIGVFLFTAFISVVTGGTSLITVPVMMQLGIQPHVAVATNMLTLVFLSLGGTIPFLKGERIPRKRLPALIGLTNLGSILGALMLLVVPAKAMPLVVASAMLVVAAFSLTKSNAGVTAVVVEPDRISAMAGYVLTVVLGVYGGFFSGGYVALLTAVFVAFFGMTFLEAVAVTKVLNFFSSLIATAVFAVRGLIDWKLGLLLGVASFAGAAAGAVVARKLSNHLLRRVFLVAVVVLAIKTLLV